LRLVQNLVGQGTAAWELPLGTFIAANLDTGGEVRGEVVLAVSQESLNLVMVHHVVNP
jgi:hypothetical protein